MQVWMSDALDETKEVQPCTATTTRVVLLRNKIRLDSSPEISFSPPGLVIIYYSDRLSLKLFADEGRITRLRKNM